MKPFSNYYNLQEAARYKFSQQHIPLFNVSMFSVFIEKDLFEKIKNYDPNILTTNYPLLQDTNDGNIDVSAIKRMFKEARNKIIAIGFPAMHANVVLGDNYNTQLVGYAHANERYMYINVRFLVGLEQVIRLIIHEWAHLWEFNNSARFRDALQAFYIGKVYNHLNKPVGDLSGSIHDTTRRELVKKGAWSSEYGLSNWREIWATGIERFLKLPDKDRKAILKLMAVRGGRKLPNRRMRKHNELKNK